jgi:hypothetical protein
MSSLLVVRWMRRLHITEAVHQLLSRRGESFVRLTRVQEEKARGRATVPDVALAAGRLGVALSCKHHHRANRGDQHGAGGDACRPGQGA